MKRSFSIEFLVITIVGLLYFVLHAPALPTDYAPPALDLRPIPNLLFDTSVRPVGTEHERLAGVILPIQIGLQRYGHIPFWNSYLSNGVPLINNAFNYLFNPFHSLPILILGGVTGSKIATIIALLIAGYSMWTFGLAIGLGALARVTIALLYMLNGSIAAKFGAGHFQLACSLAWPPLVLAALWWTLHSSKRRAPILFGISFALLFYAGNIYYVLHTAICCTVIVVPQLIERNQGRWHFRPDRLRRVFIAGIFAFGLAALQFFPVWEVRDFVTHSQQEINVDGTLANNYDAAQAINNLIQPWQVWGLHHPETALYPVDYAYVGNIVFVLIALAFILQIGRKFFRKYQSNPKKNYTLITCIALFLALLMMLWAGGQIQPFPWLYAHIPLLAQFRFLGRALSIAALWWILLAGIALDSLWNWLCELKSAHPITINTPHRKLIVAYVLAALIWLFMVIYSASNAPDRITMVMRNVNVWESLDTIRYTSLLDALQGLIQILLIVATIDVILLLIPQLGAVIRRQQPFPATWLITKSLQIALLGGVTFGILNVMTSNRDAFEYSTGNIPFDAIYDDIRRADTNAPFPAVALPFSPYTFGAYEHEVRVWSLNEGWLPAASPKTVLHMGNLSNPPRWLIAKHKLDGTLYDDRVPQIIRSIGYELRGCYIPDAIMRLESCSVRKPGFNVYEFPQALPYTFTVSEPVLTNNASNLHLNQVKSADVLLYQQDNIIIHVSNSWTDFEKHYLVVQEANFPGWQVTVDGVVTQPMTVPTYFNGEQPLGLLAIPIEQGNHTYSLRFEPPGLSTGILVFFSTLIAILAYLKLAHKQKSPA